ncbi:MAG: DUF3551 domain-containing protein [Pseudorhodoplanes sp.]|nr:DUF3551 domain-containing protein [Pseudorhodoplanes sp.]
MSQRQTMTNIAATAALVIAGLLLAAAVSQSASAQGVQTSPWCAQFTEGNGTDCSYPTFQACQATISGVGGQCNPNPFSPSNPPRRGLLDQLFRVDSGLAQAQANRPAQPPVRSAYCASFTDGGRNCGFPTLQACRQAVSGVGGTCRRNPRAS